MQNMQIQRRYTVHHLQFSIPNRSLVNRNLFRPLASRHWPQPLIIFVTTTTHTLTFTLVLQICRVGQI